MKVDLRDPDQRAKLAETLRLAADAVEASRGEFCDVTIEPHHDEAYVARFLALKKTGAVRVTLHLSFVADAGVAKLGA